MDAGSVIRDLQLRFASLSLDASSELLLLPTDAIAYSIEAERLGLPTTGVDVWVAAPSSGPFPLTQDWAAGRYVPMAILDSSYAVPASHAIVRDYIERWLPATAIRVHVGVGSTGNEIGF